MSFTRDFFTAYAAVLSTVVFTRQILTELPNVDARGVKGERVGGRGGAQRVPVYWADVTNTGRRPRTIKKVVFLGIGNERAFFHLPSDWVQETPFTLTEGQYKNLILDLEGPRAVRGLPSKLILVAQDSVGRWWPRRQRPRLGWRRLVFVVRRRRHREVSSEKRT